MAKEEKKSAKPAGGAPQGAAAKGGDKKAKADKKAASSEPRAPAAPRPADYKPRMKSHYEKVVRNALKEKFGYANVMQIPKIEKIVINMGVGEASQDRKKIDAAVQEMQAISGQKPIITRARKSIAAFKLRDGMIVGCKVTLRGERMYEFLDRLVTIALPRVRDFRGLNAKSFDGRGNYALGIKEQIIFPEIEYDKVERIRGMDVIICTSARNDNEARELLKQFNMPFAS